MLRRVKIEEKQEQKKKPPMREYMVKYAQC